MQRSWINQHSSVSKLNSLNEHSSVSKLNSMKQRIVQIIMPYSFWGMLGAVAHW